jgi:hypothetical protein
MSFQEIERVIGAELPNAAHAHRAWWSNNPSNNVMTKSWLAAGFVSERVDMGSQRLVFRRQSDDGGPDRGGDRGGGPKMGMLEALRARLAGTVTIPEGVDIMEPTGEIWDAEQ